MWRVVWDDFRIAYKDGETWARLIAGSPWLIILIVFILAR